MVQFRIVVTDPLEYKERIIAFWNAYLPGTPAERFDWLYEGNPAGRTIWFLAFEQKSGEIAGVVSLTPRMLQLDRKPVRAGIMGDLMVAEKYRVFGPFLLLPKAVIGKYQTLGFDCIYTIPNADSKKIVLRAGFTSERALRHLVKPVALEPYLKGRWPPLWSRILGSLGSLALRYLSTETLAGIQIAVHRESTVGHDFDALWHTLRQPQSILSGDRSAPYLAWRYLRNPQSTFHLLTVRHPQTHALDGYLFCTIVQDRMEIYDIVTRRAYYIYPLVREAARLARRTSCRAMYMLIGIDHPLTRILKTCLFLDAHGDITVLYHTTQPLFQHGWSFVSGDRNI